MEEDQASIFKIKILIKLLTRKVLNLNFKIKPKT